MNLFDGGFEGLHSV